MIGKIMGVIAPGVSATITVFFTAVFVGWLQEASKFRESAEITGEVGHISPGKTSAWLTVIGGILIMLFGLGSTLFGQMALPGVFVTLFGASIAGFMSPSLFHIHDVRWTEAYIEGPSKLFGPTLGRKRTRIDWKDVNKFGRTITDYWYVESVNGQRVYWSYLYPGYGHLMNFIAKKCPFL